MACATKDGVKNILITFTDCDTEEVIGPISHKQPVDADTPVGMFCSWANTDNGRGRVTVAEQSQSINLTVQGDPTVPLAYYQGCASVKVQIEWFTGEVWTGYDGNVTEPDQSNRTSITMNIVFEEIDVMLPASGTAAVDSSSITQLAAA